jgi:hypothetical protein
MLKVVRWTAVAALGWLAGGRTSATANDLSRDEEVIFFPTAALYDKAAPTVTFFVHGWCFEPEQDSLRRQALLNELVDKLQLDQDAATEKIFRERGARFLVDNERNQNLLIRLGPRDVALSTSEANGHIRSLVTIPTNEVARLGKPRPGGGAVLEYKLTTPAGDRRTFAGKAHLLAPEGWSVVSDIDDTIKDSNVLDKRELMRNTLLRDFKPVAGMAAAYAGWLRGGAAFHYVSGSPWQLYPPLAEFCTKHGFPEGSFQLRYFRVQDGSALAMLDAPEAYKLGAIAELMKSFPKRKFLLVGDTGEKDPEVYGEAARRHPGRVHLIAVRNITGETLDNPRLQAAFKDVPRANLVLFREAGELPSLDAIGK